MKDRKTARQMNAEKIATVCVHRHRGHGGVCGAGVDLTQWSPGDRPCRQLNGPDAARAKCSHFRLPTEAEVEQECDSIESHHAQLATARAAIVAAAGAWTSGKSQQGVIDCPICKGGKLRYMRSGLNGHIHAACTTDSCVRWME